MSWIGFILSSPFILIGWLWAFVWHGLKTGFLIYGAWDRLFK